MPAKNNWKDLIPKVKDTEPKPLTAISAAIGNKDIDGAIWATLSLYLHELRYTDTDTNGMKMLLKDLAKVLLELKKSSATTDGDKEKMLAELMQFIQGNDAKTE